MIGKTNALAAGGGIKYAEGSVTASAVATPDYYSYVYGVVSGLDFKVHGIAYAPETRSSPTAISSARNVNFYILNDDRTVSICGGERNMATSAADEMKEGINAALSQMSEGQYPVFYIGTNTSRPSAYYGEPISWYAWGY